MGDTVVAALNAGGGAYTASNGTEYLADQPVPGSYVFSTTASIAGTADDTLYQSERWRPGGLSYDIPVGAGDYLVTLRFAEIYFKHAGKRIFDVKVEGKLTPALDDVDLVALVGPKTAYDVTVPVTVGGDGKLDVDVIRVKGNPKISAIEVVRVDDSADPPSDLDVTPKSFAEEAPFEATLTATDPDSTEFVYSVKSDPSGLFAVQGDRLVLTEEVDFEDLPPGFAPAGKGKAQVELRLRVEDEGGRGYEEDVTLTVNDVNEGSPVAVNFTSSNLLGESVAAPTSLQFGPDGRLYVAELDGRIHVLTVAAKASGGYEVTASETIGSVAAIQNHDDDGAANNAVDGRQVTGIVVTGTAAKPVIYVSSSDPRWGAGAHKGDVDLDTNSGIITRLTKSGSGWQKLDVVRGLPRSEENHSTNGLEYDPATNTLYVAQGGHTNAGAPSQKFAYGSEYALSAAILKIDLDAIGNSTYDLPTVDDPTRANEGLWGGNDGLNMAKLVPGGPVQVHSPGYRNAYDLTITQDGRMYTVDNGPNKTWGGWPDKEGGGNATNKYDPTEPGSDKVNNKDGLHLVTPGHYAGHPNPLRANPDGAGLWTDDDDGLAVWRKQGGPGPHDLPASWLPVHPSLANPVEGDYRQPGTQDGALHIWGGGLSVNGIDEYTAGAFGGQMEGDLVTAALDSDQLFRVELNGAGDKVTNVTTLAENFANRPIDVVAQGDGEPFAGTMWVASLDGTITVFTPTGGGGTAGDRDGDGYTDADEVANGTDPDNAASTPPDLDGDFTSDLNDGDDDNDGVADAKDHFARDAANGTNVVVTAQDALLYPMFATDPGTGMFGLGFTGLMSNGKTDYLKQYEKNNLLAGGATGTFTVIETTKGDAIQGKNNQHNGFQFGVEIAPGVGAATVTARVLNPFKVDAPEPWQSVGLQIGAGHQDAYLKIVLANGPSGAPGGIQVVYEEGGKPLAASRYAADGILTSDSVDLFLKVDPGTGVVVPSWQYTTAGGQVRSGTGDAVATKGDVKAAIQGDYVNQGVDSALAVGVLSTHIGTTEPIEASYDSIAVYAEPGGADAAFAPVLAKGGATDLGALRAIDPIEAPVLAPRPAIDKGRPKLGEKKTPYDRIVFDDVEDRTAAGVLRDKPGMIVVPGGEGLRLDATDTLVLHEGAPPKLGAPTMRKLEKGKLGVLDGALDTAGKSWSGSVKAKDSPDDVFVFRKKDADPTVGAPPDKPGEGFGVVSKPVKAVEPIKGVDGLEPLKGGVEVEAPVEDWIVPL